MKRIIVLLFALALITFAAAHPISQPAPATSGMASLDQTYEYLNGIMAESPVEHLYLIELNNADEVIGIRWIGDGNETRLDYDIIGVISTAKHDRVTRIALVHNHPLSIPEPSPDDIYWMQETANIARLNGITLVDAAVAYGDGITHIPQDAI